MKLPDRARPLIDALRSFSAGEALHAFREDARERFGQRVGEKPGLEGSLQFEFEDYLLFGHRDSQGRSVVDHFLAEASPRLEAESREAFARLDDSVFGFFRVEALRPGEYVVLRRVSDDEEFEVTDTQVSRSVGMGAGVVARLLPYQDGYEFGGPVQVYEADEAYGLERALRRLAPEERDAFSDPLHVYAAYRKLRQSEAARSPENQLEAEVIAASVFDELGMSLSVSDIQQRFRLVDSPLKVLAELELAPFESERDVERFTAALTGLWNHSPRPELGEKTPHETEEAAASAGASGLPRSLAKDLLATIAARVDPEAFADETSRRAAVREIELEWFETPQEELDGHTPAYILRHGQIPPLPAESELPPRDVPIRQPASLEAFLEDVLRRPRAAAWALGLAVQRKWIEALDGDLVIRAARTLLESSEEPGEFAAHVLRTLHDAPQDLRVCLIDDVCALLKRSGLDEPVLQRALEFLRETPGVPGLTGLLSRYLSHDSTAVRLEAIRGVDASDLLRAGGLDELSTREGPSWERGVTLARILLTNDSDAIARALDSQMGKGPSRSAIVVLQSALSEFGVSLRLCIDLKWALFPDPGSEEEGAEPDGADALDDRLGALIPRSDPVAGCRAHEVLPAGSAREILRLVDSGDVRRAGDRLLEAAMAALRLLIEEGAMSRPARSILLLLETVKERHWVRQSNRERADELLPVLGAVLAWAIRGRDLDREWEDAKGDAEKVAALCRVDLGPLEGDRIEEAAELLDDDDLLELCRSPDEHVSALALAAMALREPETVLTTALDRSPTWADACKVGAVAARRHGDRMLPALVDWACYGDDEDRDTFFDTLAALGTKRAAVAARQALESTCFHGGAPPYFLVVFERILDLGDAELMDYVLERFGSGAFDLGLEVSRPAQRAECVRDVAMLLEILDRDEDPEAVVDAAIERSRRDHGTRSASSRAVPFDLEDDLEDDFEDDLEDDFEDEELFDRGFGSTPVSGGTIRREAPKIGRNQPCPCGSGRKYKKCCGKPA